jgi:hypothetical protein
MTKRILLCQPWSVKESGKPTFEGEFCSLHTDEVKLQAFVVEYWKKMPKEVPDTYLCVAEAPGRKPAPFFRCQVDEGTYDRIAKSDIGLWSTVVPQATTDAMSMIPASELMSITEGLGASS